MPPVTTYRSLTTTSAVVPPAAATSTADTATAAVSPNRVPWSGVIGVEGQATGDGRLIETNALVWDALPLPLRYVPMDVGAHAGAYVVGMIETLGRAPGGDIIATGTFDLAAEYGEQAMADVRDKRMDGVSMDLDDVSFEVRVRAEVLEAADAMMEELLFGDPEADGPREVDEDGRVVVATISSDDELMVTTSARVRAATLVSIPAFNTARIALADAPAMGPDSPGVPGEGDGPSMGGVMPDGETECSCTEGDESYDPGCTCGPPDEQPDGDRGDPHPDDELTRRSPLDPALVAGAAPDAPPQAWFAKPSFREATALTVTPEGRVYGHLAIWGTCHISHTHSGCVTPPHSAAGYAYFHTGAVLTAEGTEVPVGHITLDTRHAGERLSAAAASAHYEHTGHVVADIAAGEDSYGIWVAGALRPSATETQIRALRSAPLSGDWRRLSGNLELVAALAVNVPGFPVPRPRGLVAGGVALTLLASGMVPPRTVLRPGTLGALSIDDLRYLKKLADRERAEEQRAALAPLPAAAQLARRVRASALAMRAHRRPAPTPSHDLNWS